MSTGLVVGVSGSAGSGKSTLCHTWESLGAEVVDADALGRTFLLRGSPVFDALVLAFGTELLGSDGHLDRRRLGARVFADRLALEQLNSLVHPPLLERLRDRVREFRARTGPPAILVLDAALLAEWADPSLYDRLVVVTAPLAEQLARLQSQRGLREAQARAILDSQMPEPQRVALADHHVINDSEPGALEQEARRLWASWQPLLTRQP